MKRDPRSDPQPGDRLQRSAGVDWVVKSSGMWLVTFECNGQTRVVSLDQWRRTFRSVQQGAAK